jgi:hypothetical protein
MNRDVTQKLCFDGRSGWAWLLLGVVACGGGALEVEALTLPTAAVGELYAAPLVVEDGVAPHVWSLAEGDLPEGLVLNPAGAISGIPELDGSYPLVLEVRDARGAGAEVELQLEVEDGDVLRCGERIRGRFKEGASLGYAEVDWEAVDGYRWISVQMPDSDVTRMEILSNEEVGHDMFVFDPAVERSTDLSQGFTNSFVGFGLGHTIDLGTSPDLESYRAYGEPIDVLLVADEADAWTLELVCSSGPVLRSTEVAPVRLGETVYLNYGVLGVQEGVLYETDPPLPDWLSWDPVTGNASGVAPEVGVWEFEVIAVDEQGRSTQALAGFAVYEPTPIACGDVRTVVTEEGYYAGDFDAEDDPRGMFIGELTLDPTLTRVRIVAMAEDGAVVRVAWPGEDIDVIGVGELSDGTEPLTLEVGWHGASGLGAYLAEGGGSLQFTAASFGVEPTPLELSVICEDTPVPLQRALPVVAAGGSASVQLDGVGGVPPYAWSLARSVDGVSLGAEGGLAVSGLPAGVHEVPLRLEDSRGVAWEAVWPLYVGEEAACQGHSQLGCGEQIDGVATAAFYEDDEAGREMFCLTGEAWRYKELTLLLTSRDEGRFLLYAIEPGGAGYAWLASASAWESSGGFLWDRSTWAPADYRDLPMFVELWAQAPGPWSVALSCE